MTGVCRGWLSPAVVSLEGVSHSLGTLPTMGGDINGDLECMKAVLFAGRAPSLAGAVPRVACRRWVAVEGLIAGCGSRVAVAWLVGLGMSAAYIRGWMWGA